LPRASRSRASRSITRGAAASRSKEVRGDSRTPCADAGPDALLRNPAASRSARQRLSQRDSSSEASLQRRSARARSTMAAAVVASEGSAAAIGGLAAKKAAVSLEKE